MNYKENITYTELNDVAKKLISNSHSSYDEVCDSHFPLTDDEKRIVHFSEELISIRLHPIYKQMDNEQKINLSQLELINFFSLTIHGEAFLIENMKAYIPLIDDKEVQHYLRIFIDEEVNHTYWFKKFCKSVKQPIVDSQNFQLGSQGEKVRTHKGFLFFFVKVYLFEQVSMIYNRILSKDSNLPALVRSINQQHLIEEGRHVSFGINFIEHLFSRLAPLYPKLVDELNFQVNSFEQILLHGMFNPEIYEKCQINQPYKVKKEALEDPTVHNWFHLNFKHASLELRKRNFLT